MTSVRQVYRTVGGRIREERLRLGLTQGQLAERAGLSTNYIAHLEQGSRGASVETLCQLAEIIETPVARLFENVKPEPIVEPAKGELRRAMHRLRRFDAPTRQLVTHLLDVIETWQRGLRGRKPGV